MSVMRYEREDSAVTLCKWDHPASEQVTFYDAAVAPLLHSRAREQLAFGVLELEQSACAALSWSSSFHGSSLEQQLAASSANCSSPALWQQKSGITAKQNFCQGDFMGFALGRVMAASTADGMLAAASTPAQLLQLSSHMFRFTAQPPARSSQPDDQTAAASKQIAVLLHDSIEANPLAHVSGSIHNKLHSVVWPGQTNLLLFVNQQPSHAYHTVHSIAQWWVAQWWVVFTTCICQQTAY